MQAWEAIQKSLDSIEEHLADEIDIASLAKDAALSPYYFQRLFSQLIGKPVGEYIKLRRLAKASRLLETTSERILDIALDHGFSDHANFTRAFRNAYGITPEEFRRHPEVLNHFIKQDLGLEFDRLDGDGPYITDGIVVGVTRQRLENPRFFHGIIGEVPCIELAGGRTTGVATAGKIWDDLHRLKPHLSGGLPHGMELGILNGKAVGKGCCAYMAGVETVDGITTDGVTPDGYASYTLPPGDYVVCRVEAESFQELIGPAICKATQFMGGWMARHNLAWEGPVAELYGGTDPQSSGMELWMLSNRPQDNTLVAESMDMQDGTRKPSFEAIGRYVGNPLWEQLCGYVEQTYQVEPLIGYSGCSMLPGWNVKYRKAGRTLCTLYPIRGHYMALVVIGERERGKFEAVFSSFSEYVQRLYHGTQSNMGQRWLMADVCEDAIVQDIKQCIAIRRGLRS